MPVAVKVFGVESLPTKILIDRDGKIVARIKERRVGPTVGEVNAWKTVGRLRPCCFLAPPPDVRKVSDLPEKQ